MGGVTRDVICQSQHAVSSCSKLWNTHHILSLCPLRINLPLYHAKHEISECISGHSGVNSHDFWTNCSQFYVFSNSKVIFQWFVFIPGVIELLKRCFSHTERDHGHDVCSFQLVFNSNVVSFTSDIGLDFPRIWEWWVLICWFNTISKGHSNLHSNPITSHLLLWHLCNTQQNLSVATKSLNQVKVYFDSQYFFIYLDFI